ncbi:hypothetical protein ACFTWD_21860 [Streptomyces sp. NPDC056943]|uniref:hypothetical protein n=1 Tax=Streptomyces sp. NPDC056943 TaxID=3345971 RepID=UPI00363CEDBC
MTFGRVTELAAIVENTEGVARGAGSRVLFTAGGVVSVGGVVRVGTPVAVILGPRIVVLSGPRVLLSRLGEQVVLRGALRVGRRRAQGSVYEAVRLSA